MAATPLSTLNATQKQLIKESFDQVLMESTSFSDAFYNKLLQSNPSIRALFKGDMRTQSKKLLHMLWSVVYSLEHPEKLELFLVHYGKLHKGYGVKTDYFEPFKTTLLWALEQNLGASQKFTPETKKAWSLLFDEMTRLMKQGLESPVRSPDTHSWPKTN